MTADGDRRTSPHRMARLGVQQPASLFHTDWWLDAASDGKFERVEVAWDGVSIAVLPFMRSMKYGMRRLRMPAYTRTLGARFTLPHSKPFRRGQIIRRVVQALIDKLPPHDDFRTTLDPDDESAFAFCLAGQTVRTDFTFRVPVSASPEAVLATCDQKTRNLIRSSDRRLRVVQHHSLERFSQMSREEFRGVRNLHDYAALERIFTACLQRQAIVLLTAVDEAGRDLATAVFIWSGEVMYLWLTSRKRDISGSGAGTALIWSAIQMAHERGLVFDFDGYGSAASARFLAGFGQPAVPRLEITGESWRYRAAELVRQVGRPAA